MKPLMRARRVLKRWVVPVLVVWTLGSFTYAVVTQPPVRRCVAKTFAGGASAGAEAGRADHWPHMHGPALDGYSSFTGPRTLPGALAWRWHHPQGRFFTTLNGVVIDGSSNLYVGGDDSVVKLSPDGAMLWTYCSPSWIITSVPTLMGGRVFGSTVDGFVYALDATTGAQRWIRKVADHIGFDTHAIAAHGGRLIVGTDPTDSPCCGISGGAVLQCLDAVDGSKIWEFRPDSPVWNFHAVFLDDGTFAYQDREGRAYRNRLSDGSLIWKRGGMKGTWNDGAVAPAPDGLVYAVATQGPNEVSSPGVVTAYRLEDGEVAWEQRVPTPPNQFPAIGRLGKGRNMSVVASIGLYHPSYIYAYDAITGAEQWSLKLPKGPEPGKSYGAAGDAEGRPTRMAVSPRDACNPNAWSNAAIDAAGTVYIGHAYGRFFALRDDNEDGVIDTTEVSSINTESAFPGSGPALAPGLVAVANCDSVLVFKSKS